MSARKAIAMISGGLDSTLALALVKQQGFEVKAVNFYTGFCITETQRRKGGRQDGSVPQNEALRAAADLEVDIEYVDISDSGYLDLIVNPRHGYGSNANPCIDCRVFMMRKAREIMVQEGADFVFTGEVLGQRPKSQRRDTLRIIERDSGLDGRLRKEDLRHSLEPDGVARAQELVGGVALIVAETAFLVGVALIGKDAWRRFRSGFRISRSAAPRYRIPDAPLPVSASTHPPAESEQRPQSTNPDTNG